MKRWIKIHSKDDVAVALDNLEKGETVIVDTKAVLIKEEIPRGHKFALKSIEEGATITKYGHTFGIAKEAIALGERVHVHNTRTSLGAHESYAYNPSIPAPVFKNENRTFMGYKRATGEVGIRNEVWIIPTVGCVNGTATSIMNSYRFSNPLTPVEIKVWTHPFGCSQLGEDHLNTQTIIADMIKHPNAGGVLVLGLGCENNHISQLKERLGEIDETRILFLEAQKVSNEIHEGIALLDKLVKIASGDQRIELPLSALNIGLKCGGSDGLSGITANPLVGIFSDYMVAQGASTILTEVPEMFGAETVLMARARDKGVFDNIVNLIEDFKGYYESHHQPIYENPSPGNKEGGITTLEDKSLGCIQKGGHSEIQDVLKYGERLKVKGLSLLEGPGNDLVASTALAASGCHMVLFTTGRGTPFGTFVPTLKISSNSELANNKPHWIDFDAGKLLMDEVETLETVLPSFVDLIVEIANGEKSKNEVSGYAEIAIFKTGVTL
ncbi:UxaA family hydrolase [Fusibacter sp. 3D3]|uniref:UxaA family hydrolase n=1 Tax=Fusibacter sp. 3D3 TaxID=1048380 RepID=UPI00085369E1|nr:altronate dehydratase family protein [Fusibacter sp. 3D3]GAU75731.1 altronate dehydratase [Fusibacter sp. 3D3]